MNNWWISLNNISFSNISVHNTQVINISVNNTQVINISVNNIIRERMTNIQLTCDDANEIDDEMQPHDGVTSGQMRCQGHSSH